MNKSENLSEKVLKKIMKN